MFGNMYIYTYIYMYIPLYAYVPMDIPVEQGLYEHEIQMMDM